MTQVPECISHNRLWKICPRLARRWRKGYVWAMGNSVKIVCPQCGFCRQVDLSRLPKGTVIANCPKCACRFRYSVDQGVLDILPPKGWHTMPREPAPAINPPPEEEEDIRQVASRAYEREAARFPEPQPQRPAPSVPLDNPWDLAPGQWGWLAAFYQTMIRVMFAAPAFFRNLPSQNQQLRPLAFYLLICVWQCLAERFWGEFFHSLLAPGAAGDPQLERLLEFLAPHENIALALLIRCGFLILQLYFLSFLMYLVYRVMNPAKATFALIFQIMAYSAAPAVLCVIPVLGSLAGLCWSVGCLAVGCKAAMSLTWGRTLAGFLPIIALFTPLLAQLLRMAPQ